MGYSCRNKQFLFFSYTHMSLSKKIPNISQSDIYHFGLDMLEIFGSYRDESEIINLECWKINASKIEEFTVTKFSVNNYLYKVEFKLEDTPMFAFYKWNRSDPENFWTIKTNDYFCFYGSAFHLLEEAWVLVLMNRFWVSTRFDCIKRFDLCMDIPFHTTEVYETFGEVKPIKTLFYWTKNRVETFYIGAKKTTENKYTLIRVYNKLKDIHKNGKEKLYAHYYQFGRMTRLEIEIRRELARNLTLEELFVPENQMDIFLTQFTKYTKLFQNFTYNKQSLFRKKETKNWEDMASLDKERRVKMFLSYAERIWIVFGVCPIQLLCEKKIYLPSTIERIEKYGIHDYINQIHIKRNWRINIDNILDRQSLYDTHRGN